jgi:hypothetical protein
MITGSKSRGKPKATISFETKKDIDDTIDGITLLSIKIIEGLSMDDISEDYRRQLIDTKAAMEQILSIIR